MAISFQNITGTYEKALLIREKRSEMIANNIVNADTPNYKAKDIDFQSAMKNAVSGAKSGLQSTHQNHFNRGSGVELYLSSQYRVPNQADTGDGNTVDAQLEKTNYSENALQYNAALTLLSKKFKGLMTAIKGGR
jgi:flagellar basal-body rod protein FlgB